jgi:hypothetical protein
MLYGGDRRELRQVLFRAWDKYRRREPLEGAESTVVAVALLHPEYHRLLDEPERHETRDYSPELGESNPFLHLALHIAIAEQLATDQPGGIRAHCTAIRRQCENEHDALHAVMECLAETLWQAGRAGTPPDTAVYLACLVRRAGGASG